MYERCASPYKQYYVKTVSSLSSFSQMQEKLRTCWNSNTRVCNKS